MRSLRGSPADEPSPCGGCWSFPDEPTERLGPELSEPCMVGGAMIHSPYYQLTSGGILHVHLVCYDMSYYNIDML